MRAIWKGSIGFGLVNIPVALYTATRGRNEIKFHLLRDTDSSPIRYQRIAETDGKEVGWEHIVKGYEYEKGQFVVLAPQDFERGNVKSNQMVDIKEFVKLDEIDPMFFDEPYFLAPEKGGVAKVMIRTREHLAAVKPLGNTLVLELMHFANEIAAGGKEISSAKPHAPKATKIIDLVAVLQQSLNQTRARKKASGSVAKKRERKAA